MQQQSRSFYWVYGLATALSSAVAFSAEAQEAATKPALLVELNTAQTVDSSCRLSFLIQNEHATEIASAVFETVLFNTDGSVNQLTLFDFGSLPSGRPRVRQFEVPSVTCEGLGPLLINGASTCDAGDLGNQVCASTLMLSSRTDIEVLG